MAMLNEVMPNHLPNEPDQELLDSKELCAREGIYEKEEEDSDDVSLLF